MQLFQIFSGTQLSRQLHRVFLRRSACNCSHRFMVSRNCIS
nr:MAG TPA: hypothetical protein [Caudoviricetes sp.]